MSLDFYRAFEDRHRGTRESILERQRVYLPFLQPLAAAWPEAGVADLGCGRGEWLELLRNENIPASGADLDEGMLAACRERGLDVRMQDAVEFLRAQPTSSRIAVSGFHIAEHLPFDVLQALVREALRVVKPGGLLILETPNPENLVVGTASFYLDPTHEKPLPWQLLQFLAEHTGFARVKVLRLQEPASLHEAERLHLIDVLGGASPDYAIVAQKEAAPGTVGELDALFAREFGLSLDTLAVRYDRKLRSDIHEADVRGAHALAAAESARQWSADQLDAVRQHMAHLHENLAQELQATAARLAHDVHAAGQRAIAAEHMAWTAHQQLAAIYQSRSWRITAPLRAAMDLARRGRDRAVVHLTPERVERVARLARRVGLHGPLRRLYRRFRGGAGNAQAQDAAFAAAMTPAAESDLSPAERRALLLLEPADRPPPEAP